MNMVIGAAIGLIVGLIAGTALFDSGPGIEPAVIITALIGGGLGVTAGSEVSKRRR